MFDINLSFEDIKITSVEKEDLVLIQKWINIQDIDESFNKKPLPFKDFFERFLEYYVSENEMFLKIEKQHNIIGIFKGRMEFKKTNEMIIWYFLMDNRYRNIGIGSKIVKHIVDYAHINMNIDDFSVMVMDGNHKALSFWHKQGFELIRVAKDFFQVEEKQKDMMVLRKTT